MADIQIIDAEKHFGPNHVIRKLNLHIKHGEFVVLLGPSGCGKTTTLRAIAGLESIDSGEIRIGERRVDQLPPQQRDTAFVFQLYSLYPHLTAFDNIAFPLRAAGMEKPRCATGADVAKVLRIDHLLKKRPSALAGGDMQRVTIGRALVRRPSAMLMDEPIGALDAKLREEMRTELRRLHVENDSTTVYVTHDQVEAMAMADKIGIMHDGPAAAVRRARRGLRPPGEPVRRAVRRQPDHECHRLRGAGRSGTRVLLGDDVRAGIPRAAPVAGPAAAEGLAIGVRPEAITHAARRLLPVEAHLVEPLGPTTSSTSPSATRTCARARQPVRGRATWCGSGSIQHARSSSTSAAACRCTAA